MPSVCSSFQAATSEAVGGPTLGYRSPGAIGQSSTGLRRGGRLGDSGGLGGSQSEGLSRARMRYTTAPGRWCKGHTPTGLLAASTEAGVTTVASVGVSPDCGAALPRPASSPNLSRGKKPEVCLSVPFAWPQGHAFLSRRQHGREVSARPVSLPAVCGFTHLAGAGTPRPCLAELSAFCRPVRGPGWRPRCRNTRPNSQNWHPSF